MDKRFLKWGRAAVMALSLICIFSANVFSQGGGHGWRLPDNLPSPNTPKDSLPYRLDPTLPSFNITLRDSATIFNTKDIPTGRPIAIMLFTPDCHHCIDVTKALLKGMDSVKDVRFYMISTIPNMGLMRKFYKEYNLDKYKNIEVVGGDYEFFFISHYGTFLVPNIVVYDANKRLIKLFEVDFTASDIYKCVHADGR